MTNRDRAFHQRQARERAAPGLKLYPVRPDGRRPVLLMRSLTDENNTVRKTPRWWLYDEISDRYYVGKAGKSKWVTLLAAIEAWGLDWEQYHSTRYAQPFRGVETGIFGIKLTVMDCRIAAEYRAEYAVDNQSGLKALVNLANGE